MIAHLLRYTSSNCPIPISFVIGSSITEKLPSGGGSHCQGGGSQTWYCLSPWIGKHLLRLVPLGRMLLLQTWSALFSHPSHLLGQFFRGPQPTRNPERPPKKTRVHEPLRSCELLPASLRREPGTGQKFLR